MRFFAIEFKCNFLFWLIFIKTFRILGKMKLQIDKMNRNIIFHVFKDRKFEK